MKTIYEFESQLWKVLERNRLADLSQFHRLGFFDEVPLYSRLSDVSFLTDLGQRKANRLLLSFGLKFLNALVSYDDPNWPFFACLTVWEDDENELIVPNVFVCSGDVEKQLETSCSYDVPFRHLPRE